MNDQTKKWVAELSAYAESQVGRDGRFLIVAVMDSSERNGPLPDALLCGNFGDPREDIENIALVWVTLKNAIHAISEKTGVSVLELSKMMSDLAQISERAGNTTARP